MNPLLIAGIVLVSARVCSAIFHGMTDDERIRATKIAEDSDQYDAEIQRLRSELDAALRPDLQQLLTQTLDKKNRYLYQAAYTQLESQKELYTDIQDTLNRTHETLRDTMLTALRRSSLEQLLNQLYEAKERCYSYQQYLKQYIHLLNRRLGSGKDTEPFSMLIPPQYPYVGKLVKLTADGQGNLLCESSPPEGIPVSYVLTEQELTPENLDSFHANPTLPFLVEKFDSKQQTFVVSLAKGRFTADCLYDPRLGIRAQVVRIEKNGLLLTYGGGLLLFLRSENLLKPYRKPPVRAQLTVYPVQWRYALKNYSHHEYAALVSERAEDAAFGLSCEMFPMVFSAQGWEELYGYLVEHELTELLDEWKIGPLDPERELELSDGYPLKVQFGDAFALKATLRQDGFQKEGVANYYLEYDGLLPRQEAFTGDDVFVAIDTSFVQVAQENRSRFFQQENAEVSQQFLLNLFQELRMQVRLRRSMAGLQYYLLWSRVTQKLIDHLRKGWQLKCAQTSVRQSEKNVTVELAEPEKVKAQIEAFLDRKPQESGRQTQLSFLVESLDGVQHSARFSEDCSALTIYNLMTTSLPMKDGVLTVYEEEFPYPEIQQSIALSCLRVGKMVNPQLQAAILDGANLTAEAEPELPELPLLNESIRSDSAQREAVLCATAEPDMFLIQGPPGTGKTTVIRELIEQTLRANPWARILMVSQANVAVDNALSGLLQRHKEQIVRCGTVEKMEPSLQPCALDRYYREYVDALPEREGDPVLQRWHQLVTPDKGINPDIGELLIRSRQIVGATCVGLARRRIGLERISFDLVVIDEAGKALPGEILIPVLRAKKLVLIGDHRQLPPVIHPALYDPEQIELENREQLTHLLFETSLFERLYRRVPESHKRMLETQYRMPAVVGTLVSSVFYDGRLKNGANTFEKRPLYSKNNLVCYDFSRDPSYRESKSTGSVTNTREATFVRDLLVDIAKNAPGHSVAVITPYKGQKLLLQSVVNELEELKTLQLQIDTVDAFQGSESEIVLYCTTRARVRTKFFSDFRRINVALSRAKNELMILGKLSYFEKYDPSESPLPAVSSYLKQYGKVVEVSRCE